MKTKPSDAPPVDAVTPLAERTDVALAFAAETTPSPAFARRIVSSILSFYAVEELAP